MATTVMTSQGTRFAAEYYCQGVVSSVALDANVVESFRLPAAFGDMMVQMVFAALSSFSGAYAAPTPAYDGFSAEILSADATTVVDFIGSYRFVHSGTSSTRPILYSSFDLNKRTILRQNELLTVLLPILGGGGVTGSITVGVRGVRLKSN